MTRRTWILLAVFALVLAVLAPVSAGAAQQDLPDPGGDKTVEPSETGSYIVVMEADPLVVTEGQENLDTPVAEAKAAELEESHDEALEDAGAGAESKVNTYTNALNGFSAVLSHEEAVAVAGQAGVAKVLPDVMRYPQTDSSPAFIGLTGGNGAWARGLDGEGVVVGVIDSGIWPEHPSFADDGSYPAGPVIDDTTRPNCEFGNTAANPDDAPFECNNKLVGARQMLDTYRALIGTDPGEYDSARDDDGHGTHTASTAAGNAGVEASILGEELATISGIAPRAHVIAYKGLGDLGGFTSDLAAAIDQAVADGVDVINYSIGGGAGLTGGDEIAFLFAADAGVFVATSAGNSGPDAGTVGGPGTVPWITTVGASTQKRFFEGTVRLFDERKGKHELEEAEWGWHRPRRPKYTEVSGASVTQAAGRTALIDAEDATADGDDICAPDTLDPALVAGNIVLCRRGGVDRTQKSQAVLQADGIGMILYNNVDEDNLFTDSHWVPSVHVNNTDGLAIKEYIETSKKPEAEIVTGDVTKWKSAPSMTYFSSRGPDVVAEDIIKPDITAPGLQILAGYSPTPDPGSTPPGELFAAIAGTSMSSPHVAGLYALLKQAHPEWTPAMARSALMTTADQDVVDSDLVSPADPFAMGSGHVDPGSPRKKGSAFQPGLVYDAGLADYFGFLCDAEPSVFVDPDGTCAGLEADGVPTDASDLNYPSIGIGELAGSQTVTRTVTSVDTRTRTYRVKVDAPAGYDVTVSPNRLRIGPGESASYEVTITNNGGGAIGEWAFGSLTWKSGSFRVYSPIAVQGALFDAPDEVEGSGESGSASFDVKFGYTGSYAAAPHGLVADAPTSGDIGQDPDQTYPSGDDDQGGVDKITYPISGAAFVRWEMVIPGPDDIDLFLEDSSGTIIASSTSGGTDELIELTLPADDTYTMVVHGWSVPNAPLPYTLHSWEVPLASGGSLAVDAAPTSATIGTTGTINVSWSGLAAGTTHLGAVSHTGDVGLMGLTLVSVDTRPLP